MLDRLDIIVRRCRAVEIREVCSEEGARKGVRQGDRKGGRKYVAYNIYIYIYIYILMDIYISINYTDIYVYIRVNWWNSGLNFQQGPLVRFEPLLSPWCAA